MSRPLLVHLIDDDPLLREHLAGVLADAGIAAQCYNSATAFLEAAADIEAGCVVTDIYMPGLDGIALLGRLAETKFPLPVIVITGRGDVATAIRVIKAGAVDFIEKPIDEREFIGAIRTALAADEARRQAITERAGIVAPLARLTAREHEVLMGMIAGNTNKVIAHELGVSQRTVEVHRAHVMEKTGARSVSDLVRMVLVAEGSLNPSAARHLVALSQAVAGDAGPSPRSQS